MCGRETVSGQKGPFFKKKNLCFDETKIRPTDCRRAQGALLSKCSRGHGAEPSEARARAERRASGGDF